MGKNKIAQVALGRSPEEEFKDNLRHVSTVSTQLQKFVIFTKFFRNPLCESFTQSFFYDT
jgi:hypothetical protein